MARGILRIFLGAAPGVGKTYSMLEEGHAQAAAGVDVVAGIVLDHGREATRAQLDGLETIPARALSYRGADFEELDVAALLARKPALALVDEYAHSNIPGAGNAKRWQDVEELLAAGIDVYSTVNVQHLASLGDVVEAITGVRQQETIPDEVVRRAEQIELVDIPPELLRQRMSAGNVYSADKVDAALANYFRLGNLTALRELALLWLADRVEEGVAAYRASHGIAENWPTRERVVVGLSGGAEGEVLLRRAARILSRVSGGELLAVHVPRADGVAGDTPSALEGQRQLVTDLGGSYHSVGGDDPAEALLDFAGNAGATQIVIGSSRRKPRLGFLMGPGVGTRVVRGAGDMDVHMVPHPHSAAGAAVRSRGELNKKRVAAGFVLAVLLPVLVQWGTGPLNLQTTMVIQLAAAIATALVGGLPQDEEAGKKLLAERLRTQSTHFKEFTEKFSQSPNRWEARMAVMQIANSLDMIEGRYRYIQKIGKGAFGTVVLVEDTVVDERLILKFLNPNVSQDEEMMKRFVHELRYSRKITHNNVIRIYDFLNLGGNYAISMEYFPSHTLGAEINGKKPLPFEKSRGWAIDIATGMSVAHQVGIVHRDLKPANILINDEGLLKIVDFGVAAVASHADTQLTKTGYVIGSPKYMAPEQILGKKVDHRADIYSLGVIMYEMLAGVPPYSKGDHMSVMYQHVQGRCKPCEEINPGIPAALAAVVRKAMEVDKMKRYESMDELRLAVQAG